MEGGIIKNDYNGICIQAYFPKKMFPVLVKEAEDLGFRRRGISLYKQKPHGFAGETIEDKKGIAKTLKFYREYYLKAEPERLRKLAELGEEQKRIEKEKLQLTGKAGTQ